MFHPKGQTLTWQFFVMHSPDSFAFIKGMSLISHFQQTPDGFAKSPLHANVIHILLKHCSVYKSATEHLLQC